MNSIIQEKPSHNKIDFISAAILIAVTIYGAMKYPNLPQEVPIHFNGAGEADAWGDKSSIWAFYGIMIFTFMIQLLVTIHSRNAKPESLRRWSTGYKGLTDEQIVKMSQYSAVQLSYLNLFLTTILCYIFYQIIRVGEGLANGLGAWLMPVLLIGVFVPIINMFRFKARL